MNDEAFLSAIRASPDDDTTRLVYADWLEDQGDAARGELIRVQVRLAGLDEDGPARAPLEGRERELLAANERDWLGPTPAQLIDHTFRRGFVDRAVFRGAGWLPQAEGLFARHPITELHADIRPLATPAGRRALAGVRSLVLLQAAQGWEEARLVRDLIAHPALAGLERLSVRGEAVDTAFLDTLADCGPEGLRSLEALNSGATDEDVRRLIEANRLDRLDELTLEGRRLTGASFADLAGCGERWRALAVLVPTAPADLARLNGCTSLERLHLRLSPGAVGDLPELPALRELNLADSLFTATLPMLARWPGMRQLRRLTLSASWPSRPQDRARLGEVLASLSRPALSLVSMAPNTSIPLEGLATHRLRALWFSQVGTVRHLLGIDLSGLRELTMPIHEPVSEDDLVEVLRGLTMPRLRSLSLAGLPVGSLAVEAVLTSPHLGDLRVLHLLGRFTTACLARLAAWPGLARLDRLQLIRHPTHRDSPAAEDLAHSPHLNRLTRLSLVGFSLPQAVRTVFFERLGRRFSG